VGLRGHIPHKEDYYKIIDANPMIVDKEGAKRIADRVVEDQIDV
jgi:hypothetical protein